MSEFRQGSPFVDATTIEEKLLPTHGTCRRVYSTPICHAMQSNEHTGSAANPVPPEDLLNHS
jgi:hypothetical protein